MSDTVEQQVNDRLNGAFEFAYGDEPPPGTPAVSDPMKDQVYESERRHEVGECLKLLAEEVDALRAEVAGLRNPG